MFFRKLPATLRPWPNQFAPMDFNDAQRLALLDLIAEAVKEGTGVIRVELNDLTTEDGRWLGSWAVVVQRTEGKRGEVAPSAHSGGYSEADILLIAAVARSGSGGTRSGPGCDPALCHETRRQSASRPTPTKVGAPIRSREPRTR
jgi:hypothetical protein